MRLANIEKEFVNRLLKTHVNDSEFLSELLPLPSISEEKQISIYRSNVNGAHQSVLAKVYSACLNILGEDYFNQICRAYRFEYPSTDENLNNYGKCFSSFLNKQLEFRQELTGLEYLSELASLEWCWHAAYYVENDESFSFEKLALIDESIQSEISFKVSNSFSLHSTKYPLLNIWNENKTSSKDEQVFTMPESENYYCIYRKELYPAIDVLEYKQYSILKYISDGAMLAELNDVCRDVKFEDELVCFIRNGWVTGFEVERN